MHSKTMSLFILIEPNTIFIKLIFFDVFMHFELLHMPMVLSTYQLRFGTQVPVLFAYWVFFHDFLSSADFFKINFFEKFFQEHFQSVKQFESRSDLTFCQA